jgi:hypothetical protein
MDETTPEGLRTDGPTLAEYVAAGYPAETYPPTGYAPRAEPVEAETVEPEAVEPETVEPVPRVRQYIPCTGRQISRFIAAVDAGMQDAHYATEGEVEAFLAAGK